jgi:hypothetical protein
VPGSRQAFRAGPCVLLRLASCGTERRIVGVLTFRLSRTCRPLDQIDPIVFRFRYFRHGCSSLTGVSDDETERLGRVALNCQLTEGACPFADG